MKIIEHTPNSHSIKLDCKEKTILLVSDVHYDSRYCHRELLKKHFDQCKEQDGLIFIFGDWFDVMGCHKDPRSKAQDIRPEYLKQDRGYLDLIIEDSYNFLLPYKDNLVFMSPGNHETAIVKHRDTDILNTLVFLLRQAGSPVVKGGYSGYLNLTLKRSKTSSVSKLLAYHHGYGGNAPRSKGIMRSQMDALVWSDADIFCSGHDHNKLHDFNICYKRDNNTGKIKHVKKHWIKTGNYKRNEDKPGVGGWAVEKGFIPKPIGGYFMNLKEKTLKSKGQQTVDIEVTIYEAQ